MDLQFQIREISRELTKVVSRRAENAEMDFIYKEGLRVPSEGKGETELGKYNGRMLMSLFSILVDHRWSTPERKFTFSIPGRETFELEKAPQIWGEEKKFVITTFQPYHKIPEVEKDSFKQYFHKFLTKPFNENLDTETSKTHWELSVYLIFEIVRRFSEEELWSRDERKHIPVSSAVVAALDLGIASSKQLFDVFDGSQVERKAAAERIIETYTKKELEKMVNEFFDQNLQSTNIKEIEEMKQNIVEIRLIGALKSYFHGTLQDMMDKLFVGDEEENNNDSLSPPPNKMAKTCHEPNLPEEDEADEEEAEEPDLRDRVFGWIQNLCCLLHGEYIEEEDVFDLSRKTLELVRREMMKHLWKKVFQTNYTYPDDPLRVVKGRRLVDDDEDSD